MNNTFLSMEEYTAILVLVLLALVFYGIILLRKIYERLEEKSQKSTELNEETIQKIAQTVVAQLPVMSKEASEKIETREETEEVQKTEPTYREEAKPKSLSTAPNSVIVTELEKRTSMYNQIRNKKLSEEALAFKRVRLEFIDGSSLDDLGRERYFEEHSSGSCIIVKTPDGKNLLYPYFRSKRIDKDLQPFFTGELEFNLVKRPALCQKISEKYKVIESGILT